VFQALNGRLEFSLVGLTPAVVEVGAAIPTPQTARFGKRVQALGKILRGVSRLRGGLDFGARQMRARILGDGAGGFAFGATDEGDRALDLPGGEFLATGRQEQRHLQGRRQQAQLVGGHGAELGGLNKGTKIRVEATNEPQATLHPGFGPLQKPGRGRGPHPVPIGEFLHQPRLFP